MPVGGVAQALERLGEADARQGREGDRGDWALAAAGGTSSTATGVSARLGKSLVPVSDILAVRAAASRSARTAAILCWIIPASSAAAAPPEASISWNCVQAVRQSFSVRSSMPPEPAAGSPTLATLDSSSSRS